MSHIQGKPPVILRELNGPPLPIWEERKKWENGRSVPNSGKNARSTPLLGSPSLLPSPKKACRRAAAHPFKQQRGNTRLPSEENRCGAVSSTCNCQDRRRKCWLCSHPRTAWYRKGRCLRKAKMLRNSKQWLFSLPPGTEGHIMRHNRDTRRISGPLTSHSTLQPPVHQGSQITLLFLLHNSVILGFVPFLTSHYKVVRQVYAQLQVKNAENHCYAASSLADYTLMHLF